MTFTRFAPLGIILLLAALFFWAFFFRGAASAPEKTHIPLPVFSLSELEGQDHLDNAALKNKVTILNIFASWCGPCKEEMPLLLQLQKQTSAQIYGVAWRDDPKTLKKWLMETGNPFAHVGLDNDGKLIIALGTTGVPETYVIDPQQNIAFHYSGPLTHDIINKQILPLIHTLGHE